MSTRSLRRSCSSAPRWPASSPERSSTSTAVQFWSARGNGWKIALNGFGMKKVALYIAIGLTTAPPPLLAQARDIPSAGASHPSEQTQEQRGRKLLDQMLEALGGDAWLHRRNMPVTGASGHFSRAAPNRIVIDFTAIRQFPNGDRPEAQRIGFLTDKSMILPGKKID